MNEKHRPIIGVAAAEANNIEQRQIISGIVSRAQSLNMDIAVISNILNSNNDDDGNFSENEIYDLLLSPDLDGLIFISESFVSDRLKEKVRGILAQRSDIPVIALGTRLAELAELDLRCINTDDEKDIEDLTDHLIDAHGFTNIDFLTGVEELEVSHARVRGYRRSMEKHGIPYSDSQIHFGNFWMTSGEELAEKYITGQLPMPEAVVCANDYMAYGILDKLMEHGISVPDAVTVVGYEYIWERIYHSPLLTTYQRNRVELGKCAVDIIHSRITGSGDVDFSPPRGTLVCGKSCPCSSSSEHYLTELSSVKNERMYSEWVVNSQMDIQLTNCTNIDEFSDIMGRHSFMIRYVQNMFLCLFEKWYDGDSSEHDVLSCRSVLPWRDDPVILMHKHDISRIFSHNDKPAVYYFSPLFFGERSFGYTVLMYDNPDTYDSIYKTWVKSLSNALEFMRMKNDIRYFTAFDKLSEQYDSMTGLYNSRGFGNALNYAANNSGNPEIIMLMLKIIPPDDSLDLLSTQLDVSSEITECLKMLYSEESCICGRIERGLYCCAVTGQFEEGFPELLEEKLRLLITYSSSCVSEWGLHSFSTAVQKCTVDGSDLTAVFDELKNRISQTARKYSEEKIISGFAKFLECRTKMYLAPDEEYTIEKICQQFSLSEGHFRKLYRDCFGVSFHHDYLSSKIDYAKYILITTSVDTGTAAAMCGYIDAKYFMRLFRKSTGLTAKQYRDKFRIK